MEILINLARDNNGDIVITTDGIKVLSIDNSKNEILASEIYRIFCSSNEQKYKVTKTNSSKDDQVLVYFFDLFSQIAERINQIKIDDEI